MWGADFVQRRISWGSLGGLVTPETARGEEDPPPDALPQDLWRPETQEGISLVLNYLVCDSLP